MLSVLLDWLSRVLGCLSQSLLCRDFLLCYLLHCKSANVFSGPEKENTEVSMCRRGGGGNEEEKGWKTSSVRSGI